MSGQIEPLWELEFRDQRKRKNNGRNQDRVNPMDATLCEAGAAGSGADRARGRSAVGDKPAGSKERTSLRGNSNYSLGREFTGQVGTWTAVCELCLYRAVLNSPYRHANHTTSGVKHPGSFMAGGSGYLRQTESEDSQRV